MSTEDIEAIMINSERSIEALIETARKLGLEVERSACSAPVETIEEWTSRVALKLDHDQWRLAEDIAEGRHPEVEEVGWSREHCRSLLAYRNTVAAKLTKRQREKLLAASPLMIFKRGFGSFSGLDKGRRWRPHLIAVTIAYMKRTRFGNEIARILETSR